MNFGFLSSYKYFNGNYIVMGASRNKFFKLEKRAFRVGEEFNSKFPDSIDLKITNKCSHGCPFCHESSTKDGKSFDLEKTKLILSQLPKRPIEIAIGGGNVVECLDDLNELCGWLISRKNRPRITLNIKDLLGNVDDPKNEKLCNFISSRIEGIGVSLDSLDFLNGVPENSAAPKKLSWRQQRENVRILERFPMGYSVEMNSIVVYHIIAGIFPSSQLKELVKKSCGECILVLGYKQWGRAKNNDLPDMTSWKKEIQDILKDPETELESIGFDNLACEQLGIKDMIGENTWNSVYMGDEGSCSMYIDAVKGEFARTSRSPERVSWDKIGLLDYYASLHK